MGKIIYPEEMKTFTTPRPSPDPISTSTCDRSVDNFTSRRCCVTFIFNFAYIIDLPYSLYRNPESESEIGLTR